MGIGALAQGGGAGLSDGNDIVIVDVVRVWDGIGLRAFKRVAGCLWVGFRLDGTMNA